MSETESDNLPQLLDLNDRENEKNKNKVPPPTGITVMSHPDNSQFEPVPANKRMYIPYISRKLKVLRRNRASLALFGEEGRLA